MGGAILGTVTSQSMLDFFTILMFFGFLKDLKQNPKDTLNRFKFFGNEWAILGYFITVILGYMINASPDAEVGRGLFKFMWVPNLFLYYYVFTKIKFNISGYISFFSLAFVFPNIYAVESYISGVDMLTQKTIDRAIGLVDSATYHAHANAVIFVVFFFLMYYGGRKFLSRKFYLFSVGTLFLLLSSIAVSMTRGAWAAVVFGISLFFSLFRLNYLIKFIVGFIIIFVTAFFLWPGLRQRLDFSNNQNKAYIRLNLLMVNFQMWGEHPWLGIGYGENQRRNREYWDRPEWEMPEDYIISHAHNQVVNVMATTGVIGLFFFLCFYIHFIKQNWIAFFRSKKGTAANWVLGTCLAAQICFVLLCVTDITFEYAKIRALILMVWAAMMAVINGYFAKEEPYHES